MKAKCIYISKSGKSATLAVTQNFGLINQQLSGFVGLPEGSTIKVGDELDIPAKAVRVEVRVSEDGTSFNHLIFS
jgi:hypothetical protein